MVSGSPLMGSRIGWADRRRLAAGFFCRSIPIGDSAAGGVYLQRVGRGLIESRGRLAQSSPHNQPGTDVRSIARGLLVRTIIASEVLGAGEVHGRRIVLVR